MGFMEALKSYILQNWILILILAAFIIVLATTAFLDKKATRRMYIFIGFVFILSVTVFIEFYVENDASFKTLRTVLMAIRYSATPFILAHIIFTLVKRMKWFVYIPAGVLLLIDIISIFTGIVFAINNENQLERGALGYLPFIVTGLYCAFLIFVLIRRSNKRFLEIMPIVFLAIAFISGLVFPFVFGSQYSQIFCPTIVTAIFIYHVFSILQLAKKDSLTGILNRQAYYADTSKNPKDVTAIVSIDMNGLKTINDTYGHHAGDEALITLALCIARACWPRQSAYRLGGDEFAVVCFKTREEDVIKLVERIHKYVSETKYTCSVGYSYQKGGYLTLDELLKASDENMYLEKALFYKEHK